MFKTDVEDSENRRIKGMINVCLRNIQNTIAKYVLHNKYFHFIQQFL